MHLSISTDHEGSDTIWAVVYGGETKRQNALIYSWTLSAFPWLLSVPRPLLLPSWEAAIWALVPSIWEWGEPPAMLPWLNTALVVVHPWWFWASVSGREGVSSNPPSSAARYPVLYQGLSSLSAAPAAPRQNHTRHSLCIGVLMLKDATMINCWSGK